MKLGKNVYLESVRTGVKRVAQLHFIIALVLIVQILIYDAWKLITPEAVLQRWMVSASLLTITALIWYLAHYKSTNIWFYKSLLLLLVLADIGMASFAIYDQRGMASRAIILFMLPIISSAVLLSRTAIFATAALCVAAYTTSAVTYFVVNFNEGLKIELYGEVGFYSIIFLILAWLLWTVIRQKKIPSGS